jgi:hypothetical protein
MSAEVTETPQNMPVPGSKTAPLKFKGEFSKVSEWLERFEELADANHLKDANKCKHLVRYCSTKVRQTIENFPCYTTPNWSELCEAIRELYNDVQTTKRYQVHHLEALVEKYSAIPIQSSTDLNEYRKDFIRIGGWLLAKKKISQDDLNRFFWRGFHEVTQIRLEERMLTINPKLDVSIPYDSDKVVDAARIIWNPNKFYDQVVDPELGEVQETDSEWEASGEEEEIQVIKKKKKKKAAKPTERSELPETQQASTTGLAGASTLRNAKQVDQVAELIGKLGRLSLDDPAYAAMYFMVTSIAPTVKEWLAKPIHKESLKEVGRAPSSGNPSAAQQDNAPKEEASGNNPAGNDMLERIKALICHFCKEQGHAVRYCTQLKAFIDQGILKRAENNRSVWADGNQIAKYPTESIMAAVQRQRTNGGSASIPVQSTNFIMPIPLYQMSGETLQVNESQETFAADRAKPAGRTTRKQQVMDGVYPPPLPGAKRPTPPAAPRPQPQVPVETQQQQFNPNNDDAIMEDTSKPPSQQRKTAAEAPKSQNAEKGKNTTPKTGTAAPRPTTHFESPMQKRVNPNAVMEKILNQTITISVQELLGMNNSLAKSLQEMLKFTRVPTDAAITGIGVTMHALDEDSKLICIACKFGNGAVAETIIDTGSQINVMDYSVASTCGVSINRSRGLFMRDAGNHRTQMMGAVENLPINIGDIQTIARDCWVSDNLPFKFLLGRKWQRENRIGIDERDDGTWLIFRDPRTGAKYELNAQPATNIQEILPYLQNRRTEWNNDAIAAEDIASGIESYEDIPDPDEQGE